MLCGKKKRSKLWFKVYNHYNLSIWAKLLLETDKVGRVTSDLWGYSRKKSCSKGTVQGWHQQEFRSRWHETEDGVFSSTDKRGTSPEDPPRSVHAHISLGVTKPSRLCRVDAVNRLQSRTCRSMDKLSTCSDTRPAEVRGAELTHSSPPPHRTKGGHFLLLPEPVVCTHRPSQLT